MTPRNRVAFRGYNTAVVESRESRGVGDALAVPITSFLTPSELDSLGFANLGHDVCISRHASIYNPERISLGSHVRLDDFAILTTGTQGRIEIGSYVHVGAFCALYGRGDITLEDYCTVSARVSIFTTSDDYSGEHLTNPTIPADYTGVHVAPVILRRHVLVGAHSVILPGVEIGRGSAVGALSLVTESIEPWGVYAGVPVRRLKDRTQGLLELERRLQADVGDQ